MDEREELRRLTDMIEKSLGSGSIEQAVEDIKIFANAASFLANKLDTRFKSKYISAKKKPVTRIGVRRFTYLSSIGVNLREVLAK